MGIQKKVINIAVIGAGKMPNAVHFPILKYLKDQGVYNLSMLCDINIDAAKASADTFGFDNYDSDVNKIFNDEKIDAVYIFINAQMHYEYAKKALQSNKHVFVEKPPASTSLQALEIKKLSNKNKLVSVVGFNRRFQKNINIIKSEIEKNSRIYSMEAVFSKPYINSEVSYGANSWIGVNAIHSIDLLCYLMNKPPSEIYNANNISTGHVPQNFSVLLKWDNGSHAVFSSNNTSAKSEERYNIYSLDASYYCIGSESTDKYSNHKLEKNEYDSTPENRGFYGEHLEFIKAIRGNKNPRNDIKHGIITMRLIELIDQSYSGKIDWSDYIYNTDAVESAHSNNLPLEKKPNLNNTELKSILILCPGKMVNSLSNLAKKYKIIYEETLDKLSKKEKNDIIGIIIGKGGSDIEIDSKFLDQLPSLRVMGVSYVSVKNKFFDPEYIIVNKKIPIINMSDGVANSVAEFTLMQAILGIRNASRSHETVRNGGWGILNNNDFSTRTVNNLRKIYSKYLIKYTKFIVSPVWKKLKPKIHENRIVGVTYKARGGRDNFYGSSIGIIGYSAISKKLIQLLKPFNCEIKVYSDYLTDEEANKNNIQKATMSEAINSQIVTIHRGLSDRTKKSFGKSEINALRPGTVLINTSRGEIIDTEALIDRLLKKNIFACLDVFEEEPLPKKHLLRKLPNVFLSSHISGSTDATYEEANNAIVEKIIKFLDGEHVDSIIDSKQKLDNMT